MQSYCRILLNKNHIQFPERLQKTFTRVLWSEKWIIVFGWNYEAAWKMVKKVEQNGKYFVPESWWGKQKNDLLVNKPYEHF